MSIRKIIKMGNPVLREIAKPILKEDILSEITKELILDMRDTLESLDGIGIAAPQIGVSKQLAIIKIPENSERYPESVASKEYIIINPKISYIDKTMQGFWEGCLSVPGLRGYVERPKKIQIDYLDNSASNCIIEVEDFLATVFQHELDHLFGCLYVDKVRDITKLVYEDEMLNFLNIEE